MTATVAAPRAGSGRRRGPSRLLGSTTPRVETVRPSGRSRGADVVRFAKDRLGVELLPWQEHALRAGMVHVGGRYASRTVGVMVARQNGKTRLVTVRALAGMVLWGEQVVAAAQNRDVALEAWRDALELAQDAELDVVRVDRTTGREAFVIGRPDKPRDARYKVASATTGGARGFAADLVVMDELREYRREDPWSALEKIRRARQSSQVWTITSEGDEGSVVLDRLAGEGRAAAANAVGTDSAWLEWSAPPGLSRTDPAAWQAANPALGRLILPEVIASEADHDEPEVFETEVLCRRVVALHPWLPAGAWPRCADPTSVVPDGAEVTFALEANPAGTSASIGVAWRRPDGRIHLERVGGGEGDDALADTARELAGIVERWGPRPVYVVSRSRCEAAARAELEAIGVPLERVSVADLTAAANGFHEGVMARRVVHLGDARVATHLARIVEGSAVLRPSRPGDAVDAAVVLVLARHGLEHGSTSAVVQDWDAY
jgi:hypothetical protein